MLCSICVKCPRIRTVRLHVGLFVSPLTRSAVSFVQWCLCSPQSEQIQEDTTVCGDPTIQVTSCMINPDLLSSRGKRRSFSGNQRITLEPILGVFCVGKVREQMRKNVCFFPRFIHSFCRDNIVCTWKRCIASFLFFFFYQNVFSSATFFLSPQRHVVKLCMMDCLVHLHNFLLLEGMK